MIKERPTWNERSRVFRHIWMKVLSETNMGPVGRKMVKGGREVCLAITERGGGNKMVGGKEGHKEGGSV